MCGIGGFSLSADSKIHPRQLANAMLTALEDRGYMASGVAWQTRDGSNGYYKDAVNLSVCLSLRLPLSAIHDWLLTVLLVTIVTITLFCHLSALLR
jgi:hypothetical protein